MPKVAIYPPLAVIEVPRSVTVYGTFEGEPKVKGDAKGLCDLRDRVDEAIRQLNRWTQEGR